MIKIGVYFRNI